MIDIISDCKAKLPIDKSISMVDRSVSKCAGDVDGEGTGPLEISQHRDRSPSLLVQAPAALGIVQQHSVKDIHRLDDLFGIPLRTSLKASAAGSRVIVKEQLAAFGQC